MQPLDRCINVHIEKGMQRHWSVWFQGQESGTDAGAVTKTGNLRKPPTGIVSSWLADTIGTISLISYLSPLNNVASQIIWTVLNMI